MTGTFIATREQVDCWISGRLRDLGLTHEELDAQAEDGVFSSAEAHLLWMALP